MSGRGLSARAKRRTVFAAFGAAVGTLAGSVLLMRQAFQNLMARYGQTPENAARICTENPARSIGASGFGTICVGAGVPLTRWGKDFAWKGILE